MRAIHVRSLAVLACIVACSGTEELALNPVPNESPGSGGSGVAGSSAGGTQSSSAGSNAVAGQGAAPAEVAGQGGATDAPDQPGPCSDGSQCQSPTPHCSEGGSCVACLSDADCPLDAAGRCDELGRCVACVESDDCGDGAECETATGTCQACATVDCSGSGGSGSDGEPPP